MSRGSAKVVSLGLDAPSRPAVAKTRIQHTRDLARAFSKQERAEAALREAQAEVDAAFRPWAAGRTINRDEARQHLISTGYLPQRRVWE